ncbi:MAG: YceI family protein [Leptospiraceae bacterium]|nr:YceI family protein [Leptospiraceae bacterium]
MTVVQRHKALAIGAICLIAFFQISTLVGDFGGLPKLLVWTKRMIAALVPLLVSVLILLRRSGLQLAGQAESELLRQKKQIMTIIALNGATILLPSAYTLWYLAETDQLAALFWSIQAIELAAGVLNFSLLIYGANLGRRLALERRRTTSTLALLIVGIVYFAMAPVQLQAYTACASYEVRKDVALLQTVSVTGKNCALRLELTEKGAQKHIQVRIPVAALTSGNARRDRHVQEILGAELFFQAAVAGDFLARLGTGHLVVDGTIRLKGQNYPIAFQMQRQGANLTGVHQGTLTALGIKPPVAGPGGLIARAHDALVLRVVILNVFADEYSLISNAGHQPVPKSSLSVESESAKLACANRAGTRN